MKSSGETATEVYKSERELKHSDRQRSQKQK